MVRDYRAERTGAHDSQSTELEGGGVTPDVIVSDADALPEVHTRALAAIKIRQAHCIRASGVGIAIA